MQTGPALQGLFLKQNVADSSFRQVTYNNSTTLAFLSYVFPEFSKRSTFSFL